MQQTRDEIVIKVMTYAKGFVFDKDTDLKPGQKITGIELRPIDAYAWNEQTGGFSTLKEKIVTYKGEGLFEVVGKLRTWTCLFLTPFTYTKSL